jgi:UDP-N-acetylmuramate dehydrogenase
LKKELFESVIQMSNTIREEIFDKGAFKGEIKFEEPMAPYTSLKIGGTADIMVVPEDVVSLKHVLVAARRETIPVFIIGSGTNILIRDGGLEGIVISLKEFRNIELIRNMQSVAPYLSAGTDIESIVALFVEAGRPLGSLIDFAKKNGLSGIEPLTGVPGTLGGAVCTNAGSFGTEIKDVVTSVAVMDMGGEIVMLGKDDMGFSYRVSHIPENTVILSANIVLKRENPEAVSRRTSEFFEKKKRTQPIGKPSAGCVFKNPAGDSAGRMIDAAGCKGMTVGDVEVSTVHANYFVNKGKATCRDFVELMVIVQKRVRGFSGVTLEPEIKVVGREGE